MKSIRYCTILILFLTVASCSSQGSNTTGISNQRSSQLNEQKTGYLEIAKFCLTNENFIKWNEIVDSLNVQNMTRNEIINYLYQASYENNIWLILSLDYKGSIPDLNFNIKSYLKSNRNIELISVNRANYPENASVLYPGVFRECLESLNKLGLQITFIDTEIDEYTFIVHPVLDSINIEKSIQKIGFNSMSFESMASREGF